MGGSWSYVINVVGNASASTFGSFTVNATAAGPGFVRVSSKDNGYFIRDDTNTIFFPIGMFLMANLVKILMVCNNKGEDMAWGTSYSYDRYCVRYFQISI